MITLLGSLIGFLGAMAPEFFKLFRDGKDRAHELSVMEKQIELQKLGLGTRLEEVRINAAAAEAQAIYKTYRVGIRWVDAFAGTVRPLITYLFFLLYASIKFSQLHLLLVPALPWQEGLTLAQAMLQLWNEEDQAIFSAIIAFWFGSRAMGKGAR